MRLKNQRNRNKKIDSLSTVSKEDKMTKVWRDSWAGVTCLVGEAEWFLPFLKATKNLNPYCKDNSPSSD